MTIQSPLVYELYNLASSERHLHHCAPGAPLPPTHTTQCLVLRECCATLV